MTPEIRLHEAKKAVDLARELCPHWDYESDGDAHECCHAVDKATQALRVARKECK